MAVLLQLHLLKCFPSQMTCNNPRVLPWGHFPVGCVLNRLQRAILSGCCSCSLCISQFFGSLVPSWCDLDKILPITPFSCFICSDWHARFWEVRPTRFSLFRGRITIAFLSVWQKEPRQCDVSVCRRYLSKQQRKLCFISGSIKQYPTNSNSLLLVWWVCVCMYVTAERTRLEHLYTHANSFSSGVLFAGGRSSMAVFGIDQGAA